MTTPAPTPTPSALVVNLFGGPGTGKSTTAAGVFATLKGANINADLVTEYAKDKVWEGSLDVLGNQVYILGKQYHRLWRVRNKVDVIITDSPLLLSLIYGAHETFEFFALARDLHHRFRNLNIFLTRHKPYNPSGRTQSEIRARELDSTIRATLDTEDIHYHLVPADGWEAMKRIVSLIQGTLPDLPITTEWSAT